MFFELHILQNFAPCNLNRDDSNAPKDCYFGGFRRARISSQCIKRSIRTHSAFKKTIEKAGGDEGVRRGAGDPGDRGRCLRAPGARVAGGHRPDIRSPELINPLLVDFLRGHRLTARPGIEIQQ